MDLHLKLLVFLLDFVAPLAVGYVLFRLGWMSRTMSDKLLRVAISVVSPILAVLTCWVMKLDLVLIWLPILGVVMQIVPGIAGFFMARKKYDDKLTQGGYVMSAMLQNRGVVGALSVFILFGEESYAWSRLVMGLAPLVVFGFCFPLAGWFRAAHDGEDDKRPSLMSVIISPNQIAVVGVIVGIILQASGAERPAALGDSVPWFTHALAWTTMVPLGFDIDLKRMRGYLTHLFELMGIKFILTPLLTGALAVAVGIQGDMLHTVAVLAAAPTAMNAVILGRIHKLNIHLTMAAFVFTTMVYLAVVFPLLLWWFSA